MSNYILCDSDYRLLELIWENAPVPSGELVKLCQARLGWKKSTTYTQLKRLGDKGLVQNENALVTPLVSQDQVQRQESNYFVERTFHGSLPGFVAAFLGGKTLSDREAEELKTLIDRHRG